MCADPVGQKYHAFDLGVGKRGGWEAFWRRQKITKWAIIFQGNGGEYLKETWFDQLGRFKDLLIKKKHGELWPTLDILQVMAVFSKSWVFHSNMWDFQEGDFLHTVTLLEQLAKAENWMEIDIGRRKRKIYMEGGKVDETHISPIPKSKPMLKRASKCSLAWQGGLLISVKSSRSKGVKQNHYHKTKHPKLSVFAGNQCPRAGHFIPNETLFPTVH